MHHIGYGRGDDLRGPLPNRLPIPPAPPIPPLPNTPEQVTRALNQVIDVLVPLTQESRLRVIRAARVLLNLE
jgi:hypothetical protein